MPSKHTLGALALASVAFVAAVSLAMAHSRPIRFDPAPGAVLTAAPAKVDGWFTSDLRRDPNWTFLRVTDASGTRVDAGETTLGADRRSLSVALRPGLPAGRYMVAWRGFDDEDGEIFGDCYTFFVGQAAADAAVNDKIRLDGGSACPRMEFSTRNGTPGPSYTPSVGTGTAAGGDEHAEGEEHDDGGSDGLPAWTLILGVVAGVVVGGLGGRYVGSKP